MAKKINMQNQSLISVAMTTYNGEKYLKEQLESIYAQSYKNIEVIVTDDCSADTTVAILEQYAKSHGLKYCVNEHNLGFVKNFEKALTLCRGEYIALADQDDVWQENKIQRLFEDIGDALLIHSDASLVDGEGKMIGDSYTKTSNKILRTDAIGYFFNNDATGCTMMFPGKVLSFVLPFPQDVISHDWWIAIQAKQNGMVKYIPEPLIGYRQHLGNQIGAIDILGINSHSLRVKVHQKKLLFLKMLRQTMKWSEEEREVLDVLVYYYQTYFDKNIRIVAFFVHLRYFKYFHDDKKMSYRIVGLFLSLFGEKIQKQLWRLIGK